MDRYKIMMIDDDSEDQWVIREALQELGTGDDVAAFVSNGQEALSRLDHEYAEARHVPNLIVLDLNMPLMNGTATLGKLKADDRFRDVPVIIYSTSINPFERDKCMALGAHSYITKPITIEESVQTVETFLTFCQ
ncbi:response regulator [Sediminibacterium roseum]|uniref:Response regulator n=1 Tax=Sediminibacterium roseum TaxID=1978412 RepID=A0ABW9ZQT9_9BACT|nr:response regulator [Sediminibacterium roseum]NCI49465.1 response regulator [Sediminibacterium roseum]